MPGALSGPKRGYQGLLLWVGNSGFSCGRSLHLRAAVAVGVLDTHARNQKLRAEQLRKLQAAAAVTVTVTLPLVLAGADFAIVLTTVIVIVAMTRAAAMRFLEICGASAKGERTEPPIHPLQMPQL